VGIGLGLQSLVTNLVSGLIIAFEKPVNVGDLLEVNGKMATMKSIGFRSSIIRLLDGSHMVIPNGDVLNQHLVNWSMGGHMKKTSIKLGVAYGSDIDKVKDLFTSILEGTDRILKNPPPAVFAKHFGPYSIDFELFFWVSHIFEFDPVKNDVITKIDIECKKAGILIPVPQQDINIRSMPDSHEPD
jgi:small-conductance mechanosensitive channel